MRIPVDAIIPPEKITRYLLQPRPWDDKSQFLAQAGFTAADPDDLELAIRRMADGCEAMEDGENEYGTFYHVAGFLEGRSGMALPATSSNTASSVATWRRSSTPFHIRPGAGRDLYWRFPMCWAIRYKS